MFTFQDSGWGPTEDLAVDITAQSAEGTPRLPDNQETRRASPKPPFLIIFALIEINSANMTYQT